MYKKNMMIVLYVDDAGIAAADPTLISEFIDDLREKGFELDQTDSFSSYLGIGIADCGDGSKNMTHHANKDSARWLKAQKVRTIPEQPAWRSIKKYKRCMSTTKP